MTDNGKTWEETDPLDIDAGDPVQVESRDEILELVRINELAQLKAILGSSGGRALIWRLLHLSGMDVDPPTESSAMARAVGRADLGRALLTEVHEADTTAHALMRKEAQDRADNFNRAIRMTTEKEGIE